MHGRATARRSEETETNNSSIRQKQAHQRHHTRRETDQQYCMLERHDRRRPEGLAGYDCRREVVDSFTIFFFGYYFHTQLLA